MKNNLDILIVSPTIDIERVVKSQEERKIEKNISLNESPSIGIGYLLSSLEKQSIKAKHIDMIANKYTVDDLLGFISEELPRVVGFSATTINVKEAAVIAEIVKKNFPDILICIGGSHVSIIPKETLEEFPIFDFGIIGEGEFTLPKVLKNIEEKDSINGVVSKERCNFNYDFIEDIESLPFPKWSDFDLSRYPGNCPHKTRLELPLLASRGCPYDCVFCCHALGKRVRRRSVESVIEEIKYDINNFGCTSISFLDETLVCNLKWSNELFDAMIREGISSQIKWSCSTRVNGCSEQLLKKMKEAGCYYIFFGLESGNEDTLVRVKKGANLTQARNAVKWAKMAGIIPVGSFIIGLPGDTREDILKTIEFAKEIDLYSTTFPIATPFPGTELRKMAINNEYGMRLLASDWDLYSKQNCRALDSEGFEWEEMYDMQQYAYSQIPKQTMKNYLRKITECQTV